ncbi:MAG: hypothetical protein ACPGOY_18345 [Rhodospirillaceae bacterium]
MAFYDLQPFPKSAGRSQAAVKKAIGGMSNTKSQTSNPIYLWVTLIFIFVFAFQMVAIEHLDSIEYDRCKELRETNESYDYDRIASLSYFQKAALVWENLDGTRAIFLLIYLITFAPLIWNAIAAWKLQTQIVIFILTLLLSLVLWDISFGEHEWYPCYYKGYDGDAMIFIPPLLLTGPVYLVTWFAVTISNHR